MTQLAALNVSKCRCSGGSGRGQSTRAAAMPQQVTFVTGNEKKRQEVVAILAQGGKLPFEVIAHNVDLPELQGTPEDIAREKCKSAAQQLGTAVMIEDTSLCFNAMNGLPGAFIKWFLGALGPYKLPKMLAGFDDKSAYAQCIFAFAARPHEEPQLFVGRTEGHIVEARGPTDFGWDPVFEPEGYSHTYAEMSKETKNSISHRYRALAKLRDALVAKYNTDTT